MFATLRKAYEKVLTLADRPWAEKALAGLSFAEASFFPIPPDPLLLAMGAGRPDRSSVLIASSRMMFDDLMARFLMSLQDFWIRGSDSLYHKCYTTL